MWELELTDKQQEVVEHSGGPLLVLAGAGSGKTRTMSERVKHLISNGVSPEHILVVTFTQKAANELKSRIHNAMPDTDLNSLMIGTFHSVCLRILRSESSNINEAELLDEEQSFFFLQQLMKQKKFDKVKVKQAFQGINRLKNEYLTPELLKARSVEHPYVTNKDKSRALGFVSDYKEVTKIYETYQNELKNENKIDFEDVMLETVELFLHNPDILSKYQEKFKYVIIDEYQDINRVQFAFTHLLTHIHRNITVVGDDGQSIYGFRGSDIQNILMFEKVFEDAKTVILDENFRSTKRIVEASNKVIKNNKKQKKKDIFTHNEMGDKIAVASFYSPKEEAKFVAEAIKMNMQYSDTDTFAVLYRTNLYALTLKVELTKMGIAFEEINEETNSSSQVKLMTVHAAKGLEFNHVFMVGCCEGVLPLPYADIEEERRIFYVGMTRAEETLILTYPKTQEVVIGGKKVNYDRKQSRFISEIPIKYLQFIKTKGKKTSKAVN